MSARTEQQRELFDVTAAPTVAKPDNTLQDLLNKPVSRHEPPSFPDLFFDQVKWDKIERLAEMMAKGTMMVPDHFKGKKEDCIAIILQALQWGIDPFFVAQKAYVQSGRIAYEAQLIAAVVTRLAPIKGLPKYDFFGDWTKVLGKFEIKTSQKGNPYRVPAWTLADEVGVGVTISVQVIGEPEPWSEEVHLTQAQERKSTLWATDPRQQLSYYAIRKCARMWFPGAIMGVYTPDEIATFNEVTAAADEPTGRPVSKLTQARQARQQDISDASETAAESAQTEQSAPEQQTADAQQSGRYTLEDALEDINSMIFPEQLNDKKFLENLKPFQNGDRAQIEAAFKLRREIIKRASGLKLFEIKEDMIGMPDTGEGWKGLDAIDKVCSYMQTQRDNGSPLNDAEAVHCLQIMTQYAEQVMGRGSSDSITANEMITEAAIAAGQK